LTEQSIINQLQDWIDDRQYPFQLFRSFIYSWESDYWVMDNQGITREYEIKISRHDFKKDVLKDKHKTMHEAGPNYFYYVCPKDMIRPDEIDKRYGLIYIWDSGHISVKKRPVKLHPKKYENWKHLAVKMYWKWRKLWREKFIAGEITREQFENEKTNLIS
jgi:hypothetical protein